MFKLTLSCKCARFHVGFCSPLIHSIVSHDSGSLISAFAVLACPEGTFSLGAAHKVNTDPLDTWELGYFFVFSLLDCVSVLIHLYSFCSMQYQHN